MRANASYRSPLGELWESPAGLTPPLPSRQWIHLSSSDDLSGSIMPSRDAPIRRYGPWGRCRVQPVAAHADGRLSPRTPRPPTGGQVAAGVDTTVRLAAAVNGLQILAPGSAAFCANTLRRSMPNSSLASRSVAAFKLGGQLHSSSPWGVGLGLYLRPPFLVERDLGARA